MTQYPTEEMIEARVAELSALEENWDSYRAAPIDPVVLERAKTAALTLAEAGLYACMMPHSDGGVSVNLDFDEENTLEFRPDGTATVYREKLPDDFAIYLARAAIAALRTPEPIIANDERVDRVVRMVEGMKRQVAAGGNDAGLIEACEHVLALATQPDTGLREAMKAELAGVMRAAINISRASPYWNDDMREGCKAMVENICCHLEIDHTTLETTSDDGGSKASQERTGNA